MRAQPVKREALLARLQTMPGGAALDELAPVMGLVTRSQLIAVSELLSKLQKREEVVWVHEPLPPKANQRRRYYAIQFAPAIHGVATLKRTDKPKPKALPASKPATIPPGLVPQDCGGFTGRHRHTVEHLPAGYVSQINPAECRPFLNAVLSS